jgi:hypothetical protein
MAKKEASTAVARIQQMSQEIETLYLGNAEVAVANMAFTILEANSFDDMFNEDNVPQKLYDVEIKVEEITFNRSSYGGGIPYFATFRGTANGENVLVNCSGWQPVVVAYKCLKEGWLPRNFVLHKAEKPTAAGFYPITILPAEEPF